MDRKSIIAVATDIKDDTFYEVGTTFGKLKSLYKKKKIYVHCAKTFYER